MVCCVLCKEVIMLKNNCCVIWLLYKIVILKFWELKNVKLFILYLKDSNIFVKYWYSRVLICIMIWYI